MSSFNFNLFQNMFCRFSFNVLENKMIYDKNGQSFTSFGPVKRFTIEKLLLHYFSFSFRGMSFTNSFIVPTGCSVNFFVVFHVSVIVFLYFP